MGSLCLQTSTRGACSVKHTGLFQGIQNLFSIQAEVNIVSGLVTFALSVCVQTFTSLDHPPDSYYK